MKSILTICLLTAFAGYVEGGFAKPVVYNDPLQFDAQGSTLVLTGHVVPGSAEGFHNAVRRYHPDLIELNSGGGVLPDALDIAEEIHRLGLPVRVGPKHMCASACFVMLAAGVGREISTGAFIGVHRVVNSEGNEVSATIFTDKSALQSWSYGASPLIVGLMVTTFQPKMYWLNRDELATMGVRFIP